MVTKIIGIKEFRQNITQLSKQAKDKGIRYIVMRHNKPIMEVSPYQGEEFVYEDLAQEVSLARQQVKQGNVYTLDEVAQELGL